VGNRPNLWSANYDLVLYNKAPEDTSWKRWQSGDFKVGCQILINVAGSEGKKVRWPEICRLEHESRTSHES
jgi:hypothetical protein